MIIRDYFSSDNEWLRAIHEDPHVDEKIKFPFPDLSNLLFISKKTILSDNSRIIGAGFVRLTSEAMLVLDNALPKMTKTKAVLAVAESLRRDVTSQGMDECHVFVRSSNIEKLCLDLGFKESKGGKPLVIHL